MLKKICLCDRCGKQPALPISVWCDHRLDPAGSMEDEWERIDLCHACMAAALGTLMDGKENVAGHHKYGKDFVRAYRTFKHGGSNGPG